MPRGFKEFPVGLALSTSSLLPPLLSPPLLFGFVPFNGFNGGETIDGVRRASSLEERVRFDRFTHTAHVHTRGGSEGVEESGSSVDAYPGPPLSLLFP